MPRVTVLMPVFNAESYLEEAVNSIRNQTFDDFEFVIINDGSEDNSASILDRHAAEDARIHLIHQENKGLVATLNLGIRVAKAPLLARMDADDISRLDRLECQWQRMTVDLDLAVLGGHVQLIDQAGHASCLEKYPVGSAAVKDRMRWAPPVAHPAVMMRTDWVRRLGGYRHFYRHCEDYDLWLRLSEVASIDNLDQVVLSYRWHGENVSTIHRRAQILGAYLSCGAAKVRSAGLTDPTENWTSADPALFNALPLSEMEKWRLKFVWARETLESLPVTNLDSGVELIQSLGELFGKESAEQRIDFFRVHMLLGRKAWGSGNKKLAILMAWRGVGLLSSSSIMLGVRKLFQKWVRSC